MSRFTQGKWELYPHVVRASFRVLATIRQADSDIANIAYIPVIHGFPEQEGQANARLIAVAPEMYVLLRKCAEDLEFVGLLSLSNECSNLLARIDGKDASHE